MIVDCHTHWAECFRQRDGLNPEPWLAVEAKHGVTHAVVMLLEGLSDDTRLQQENDDVAALAAKSGGRMIPFCVVNPFDARQATAEFRRSVETLGMRGLKIHPWLQGASPNSAAMDELCEMAAAYHVPVLFHDGTPCYSLPSEMAVLARRHPATTIVLGHCGMFEHWREAIAAMRYAENLWGCLCSPHLAALRELVRHCDRERLLWGSDHGFSLSDMVGYRLEMLGMLGLSEADYEKIAARNPRRLFGIG
jgi:uncharacterized protein